MEDDMKIILESQGSRIVVQDSTVQFQLTCNECGGHGYTPTAYGDIVDCDMCHGSGVELTELADWNGFDGIIKEGNDGN
tara:strand:+ start:1125 stop:1361 length:237 start_codon:yes stop_codon:yes gene_type:complete